MMNTNRRSRRKNAELRIQFSVKLHIKATERMSVNTKVAFGINTFEHLSLQGFNLHDTSLIDIIETIEEETIPSSLFQRRFPGCMFLNTCVGMKGWRRKSNGAVDRSDQIDIKTEEDADVNDKVLEEWIKHVKEHGTKVEESKFLIDIGVVVYKTQKKRKNADCSSITLTPV